MKYMMQMLTLLLSLSLMAGCSEKEENCEKQTHSKSSAKNRTGLSTIA